VHHATAASVANQALGQQVQQMAAVELRLLQTVEIDVKIVVLPIVKGGTQGSIIGGKMVAVQTTKTGGSRRQSKDDLAVLLVCDLLSVPPIMLPCLLSQKSLCDQLQSST
jgi:hypothetical protein